MNFKMPTQEEIHIAFEQGEGAVSALFCKIGIDVMELAQELEKQAKAIQELQATLTKNSKNSGKPPSSDGYGKENTVKRTESQRKKGEKPNGGQKGHTGNTLKISNCPDKITAHFVNVPCKSCGHSLENEAASGYEERQIFDIPAIHIEVTAHRAEIKICPECGTKNRGEFPANITSSTQYGSGIKTWSSYFSVQHCVPVARTAQIFEDLLNHRVSEASVMQACHQLSEKVRPVTQSIKEQLQQSDVVNFDESGVRVQGKLHWLHSASTESLTHYIVHPKRGKEAMDKAGILPHFAGTACHDHWKPYYHYKESNHALCNAHHLRELTFMEKQYDQKFAPEMADLLVEINKAKQDCQASSFEKDTIIAYEQRYDEIIHKGLMESPEKPPDPTKKSTRGRTKQTLACNLLKRLRDFKGDVLAFMHNFRVPFTNNQAEQDVRMIKVKQKVSGCFRTMTGAEEFLENRAYISTARKNNVNVFQAIKDAFEDHPFMP